MLRSILLALRFNAVVVVVTSGAAACGPAVGAEGGACTSGGACDAGLQCLSDLCVDADASEGEGEGEGEGEPGACRGDERADDVIGACQDLPSACADIADSCEAGFLVLRSGLAQGAYDCFAAEVSCADAAGTTSRCFGSLTACDNASARTICGEAEAACLGVNDRDFDRAACEGDLKPMNEAFIDAYTNCFNVNLNSACAGLHDGCFEDAFATLVNGT